MTSAQEIRLPAVEVRQGEGRVLYSFGVDGKLIPKFATVSRIRREKDSQIDGYQRPEVLSHIKEIKSYLESNAPMVPNALVIAFDSRVRFEPFEEDDSGYSRLGYIVIPFVNGIPQDELPGWIVDGQQRVAAIRESRLEAFPICVTAFITDNVEQQRSQFILVNSTKPLPKGLINELLPDTGGHLPTLMRRKRFPAHLLQRLNHDEDSPLYRLIRTPTNPDGVIKDNSVLRMLENSLTDGALYGYRDWRSGQDDVDSMLSLVKNFWEAVSKVFDEGWGVSPRKSRLMHGAGIVAVGFLMDAIADRVANGKIPDPKTFAKEFEPMRHVCRWTHGYWDFGPGAQRKWNELQNTSKDTQLLANYLLWEYKRRVWDNGNHGRGSILS